MKRSDFLGAILLISGIILFGFVRLAIANYLIEWNVDGTNKEQMSIARGEIAVNFSYFISIFFIWAGLILLFYHDVKRILVKLFDENE